MEVFDPETGEIEVAPPRRMPPEIAAAIVAVMAKARRLGTDEQNQHGKYSYVSIDKFLERFGPLMAEAGLFVIMDEPDIEVKPGGKEGNGWLFPRYDVWLVHSSGVMWGPLRRHLALPVTGPQTFGAAESYVQKRLLRGLFMVPTGDKDADEVAEDRSAPPTRPRQQPSRPVPTAATSDAPSAAPATSGELTPGAGDTKEQARKAWAWLRDAIDRADNVQWLYELDPNLAEPPRHKAWDDLQAGGADHFAKMNERWSAKLAAVKEEF